MEIFLKTKNKLIIATVIVILMNFIIPNVSQAKSTAYKIANAGGTILAPIMEFVLYLGDVVVNGLQTSIYPGTDAFLLARSGEERGISIGRSS